MPTYEYECLKCGELFEVFQRMSDFPLEECPKCKGKIKRLISSGSGLIFKGKGFYATDYKKSNNSSSKKDINSQCPSSTQPNCDQANKRKDRK